MGSMKLIASEKIGRQVFDIEPGTHTVVIDTVLIRQNAISDFVKELACRISTNSTDSIGEAVAIAYAIFDVPLSMLYDDPNGPSTIDQLNDRTLARLIRLRMDREAGEMKTNEPI